MPEPAAGNGRYVAGLDGLRALAVLAVMAYHVGAPWAPGGLVGVGVFFVLSGYLITDGLVGDFAANGRIRLGSFWRRRARRLLPALWLLLAVVAAWVALFAPAELPALRGDVVAALLYASNWWYIFHHVAYFARFGPPSPLGHLWSLAVEEQFYLLWPLALSWGLAHIRDRRRLVALTLAAAALSALAMAGLFRPGANPDRVYYGTDTRAFSLLLGAALALVWPTRRGQWPAAVPWLDMAGGAGLCAILAMVWRSNQYQPFLYRGGLVWLSLATVAVVAAAVHPHSRLQRLLAWRPLRWLGVRSYGIYLWHYPIIVLTTPALVAAQGWQPARAGAQAAASVVLAALSWSAWEDPIRRRGVAGWWREAAGRRRRYLRRAVGSAGAGLAALGMAGLLGWVPARVRAVAAASPLPPRLTRSPAPARPSSSIPSVPTVSPLRTVASPASPIPPTPRPNGASADTGAPPAGGVTVIGDSISLDLAPYLRRRLPAVVVDGRVGRQMTAAAAVIRRLKAQGQLKHTVVLELGTNGAFTAAQLQAILALLGPDRRVVLVNTREPRPWETEVNATLAQAAAANRRIALVNWFAASAGHPNYFYPDAVHPNPAGARVLAELIVRAVEAWPPAHPSS